MLPPHQNQDAAVHFNFCPVLRFRAYGKPEQFAAIDEAIRTVQFIRNKCIRLWMDNPKTNKYDLIKVGAVRSCI